MLFWFVVACKTPVVPEQQPPAPQPNQPVETKPTAKEVPVAQDFKPEVTATIVRANYRAELDAIETELHTEAQ